MSSVRQLLLGHPDCILQTNLITTLLISTHSVSSVPLKNPHEISGLRVCVLSHDAESKADQTWAPTQKRWAKVSMCLKYLRSVGLPFFDKVPHSETKASLEMLCITVWSQHRVILLPWPHKYWDCWHEPTCFFPEICS